MERERKDKQSIKGHRSTGTVFLVVIKTENASNAIEMCSDVKTQTLHSLQS